MANTRKAYYGDIGADFEVIFTDRRTGLPVSLTGTTTLQIIFLKPSGIGVAKTAVITNSPGTDGKAYYRTIAADLNEIGDWEYQGYMVNSLGSWHTDPIGFTVEANLPTS
jgi:hypothetical protein